MRNTPHEPHSPGIPGAGIEPALALKWKLLMAHGFWFKPNVINNSPALHQSAPVIPIQQSTPGLETIWETASRASDN